MQKLAKKISVLMAAVMTLSLMLNFVMAAPAKAATTYPQVQYATEPKLEYEAGDIVNFDLYTPNYGGRVQYRVVLWNDETKSYRDLWNTPDRYYANWMPYGNNIFNLHWKIDEPGHYRITIYAKRAGVPNNQTYLLGKNCDSFMESDSFVVKAKTPVATPDIPSDTLKLAAKSTQMAVGQEYAVKANVGKAGVKVIFNIDVAGNSINNDLVGEAVSDANGIATYKYTRNAADADYVTAYVAAKSSVRDAEKVYWGVKPILTIEAMDKDDAANLTNGAAKRYKVSLKNPITGEPMRYKELKVMLKENIDTAELRSTAVITNDFNGQRVTPYQRSNNVATGGLNQTTLALVTNDNGEATFTVTGYNTKATPVVFYDDYAFFNQNPNISLLNWNIQIPAPIVLPDSSQIEPAFAGNNNDRWDATELQVEPKTVNFVLVGYTFESEMDGDKYVATYNPYYHLEDSDYAVTGRIYTVTVKKPDGKPYAGGLLNVRIEQLFDAVGLSNHTDALLFELDGYNNFIGSGEETLQLDLDDDGIASFGIASYRENDIATPRVWIDQDLPYFGPVDGTTRNGYYQEGEPTKLLDTVYFVNRAVAGSDFSAARADSNIKANKDADGNLMNIVGEETIFTFSILDQNNQTYIPDLAKALVTYTIYNPGARPVVVYRPDELTDVEVNGYAMPASISVGPNETITISGEGIIFDADADIHADSVFNLRTIANETASIEVRAHAVTTRSNSESWWQPSNTLGAVVLLDKTVKASWVNYRTFPYENSNGTITREIVGTIEFYNKVEDWMVVKVGSAYYMVEYAPAGAQYFTVYNTEISYDEFVDDIHLSDKVHVVDSVVGGFDIRYLK